MKIEDIKAEIGYKARQFIDENLKGILWNERAVSSDAEIADMLDVPLESLNDLRKGDLSRFPKVREGLANILGPTVAQRIIDHALPPIVHVATDPSSGDVMGRYSQSEDGSVLSFWEPGPDYLFHEGIEATLVVDVLETHRKRGRVVERIV